MKTSHKSDELKKKGGGHKSGTYAFYKSKIHPFLLMIKQRNEMWYTYAPLGM